VELYNTDGSQGAARGAGIGAGIYKGPQDAFVGLAPVKTIEPNKKLASAYRAAYEKWEEVLKHQLSA
jgi:xylulokinase